jgi:hypothetical protein
MTTQAGITHEHHRRAVRFFWGLLIGATLASLTGNVTHAVLPHVPHVAIQIGAAAVPPIALLEISAPKAVRYLALRPYPSVRNIRHRGKRDARTSSAVRATSEVHANQH